MAEFEDPRVAHFFEELDRRIDGTSEMEHDAGSRAFLAAARPGLAERARAEPDAFIAVIDNFLGLG